MRVEEAAAEATPKVSIWQRPPGWIVHSMLGVALVLLLLGASAPGGDFGVLLLAGALLVGTGIVWIVRIVTYSAARLNHAIRARPGSARLHSPRSFLS